jgi:hypothetical protein
MRRRMIWAWLMPVFVVAAMGVLLAAMGATAEPLAAAAAACGDGLDNGGFEEDADWTLPGTAYPAAYSTAMAHSGERSLRAGILMTDANVYSYSAANQALAFPTVVPTDVETASLTVWWWPVTTESALTRTVTAAGVGSAAGEAAGDMVDAATLQAIVDGVTPAPGAALVEGDRQYVILTNENNKVISSLLWARSNAQQWQKSTFDLTPYLGRQLRVHIGVYNDGVGGVTAMYADDVAAQFCKTTSEAVFMPQIRADATHTPTVTPTGTATPTATVTMTPTVEPTVTVTPTIEPTAIPTGTTVWTDPGQAIEVFSPVANGLYHSPIELRGLSQTFEGVVNMRLSAVGGALDGEVLGERTALGGSVERFAFFDSYLRFTTSEVISATLEVFEVSAKDGSEIHKVSIPLTLLPGQRVVDLHAPVPGAGACGSVYVSGYSNTFEANVLVTLSARGGEVLTGTSTLGGNLGVYRDFTTVLAYDPAEPMPVLVGVTEASPAGFGYIDYTRVPVSLYPVRSGCPFPGAQR